MRKIIAALVLVMAVGAAGAASAQTRSSQAVESHPPAITIDVASVGGGLLGLVTATGLINLYSAGAMMAQGTGFVEAVETGTGLPLLAAAVAIVVGGIYARDVVANEILPLFGVNEGGKSGR